MNLITNRMLQVRSNFYYIAVQTKLETLGTGMVLLWSPKNSVNNRNPNDSSLVNQLK